MWCKLMARMLVARMVLSIKDDAGKVKAGPYI